MVSTPVLNMLHAAGHGVSFRLAISEQTFNLVGFAFIDDSDVIQQAPSHDCSAKETMAAAQEGLDRFVGGMRVTGGDVRPDKSWTYLIEFQWANGKWSYVEPSPDNGTLYVEDVDGDRHPIERLGVSEGRKMLGVLLAPDGNNNDALASLKTTAREWADRVRSGHLRRSDA